MFFENECAGEVAKSLYQTRADNIFHIPPHLLVGTYLENSTLVVYCTKCLLQNKQVAICKFSPWLNWTYCQVMAIVA